AHGVRAPARGHRRDPRRGRGDGHGPYDGEPGRKLPGDRRRRTLGRRAHGGSSPQGPSRATRRARRAARERDTLPGRVMTLSRIALVVATVMLGGTGGL